MRILTALVLFVFSTNVFAQFECGTSEERSERELERAATLRERAAQRARIRGEAAATPVVQARDGVFVVRADDENAPFNNQFDLAGRTLRWTPKSDGTWTVENIALAWDDTAPSLSRLLATDGDRITLPNAFPFGGAELRQVWIGGSATISTGTLPPNGYSAIRSITPHELAASKGPFISALGHRLRNGTTDLRIASNNGASVITWLHSSFEVQMKLRADGSMDFNYRKAADDVYGGVAVVTGNEPWRNNAVVTEVADETNNAISGMQDATKIKMTRYPDAGLIEFRATMRTKVDPSTLPEAGVMYDFELANGADDVAVILKRSFLHESYAPVWGWGRTENAVVIDGNDVVLVVDQNLLETTGSNVQLKLYVAVVGESTAADTVTATVSLGSATPALTTDFSAAGAHQIDGAAVESFTLPPLSLPVIWEQMKETYKLKDSDVDGVAVFQDFTTDIIFTATAYALGGNPGVSNIHSSRANMGPQYPLVPSLLHMNRLSIYSSDKITTRLLLHEFGHRWLQSLQLREASGTTRVLNPATNHPAQYVFNPSAFPVYGGDEASVMGGGNFRTNAAGLFTSTGEQGYGYSWLDLYLMGLAQPNEVAPFYYISGSSPALGSAYNPPSGAWSGTRREVTMENILGPMGVRKPAYPESQRSFKVLFVLVTDDEASDAEIAQLHQMRKLMEANFRTATGNRADLGTEWFTGGGPRRRSARK